MIRTKTVRRANVRFVFLAALFFLSVRGGAQEDLASRIHAAQSSGNYQEAATLYRQLIHSGTDSPEVRSNYGIMLYLSGQHREALAQFRTALHENPNLEAANLFAGEACLSLGEPKTALVYLERARQLDPQRPAPLLSIGKAYLALRNYEMAGNFYARAADLDSKSFEAWYGVGVTDRRRAEDLLNRAARQGLAHSNPDGAKIQRLLEGALQALQRAVALDPNSARTHLLMAESLADQNKLAEALPEYNAAIRLDPNLEGAYLGLATEFWKQAQFDQALPPLEKVLEKSPADPEANGIMADILQHKGDNEAAERHALLALKGNPDLIETRVVLARVYLGRQHPDLAIKELQQVVAADPDGSYHFLLYRAYKKLGNDAQAEKAMADFRQIRSRTGNQAEGGMR